MLIVSVQETFSCVNEFKAVKHFPIIMYTVPVSMVRSLIELEFSFLQDIKMDLFVFFYV